MAQASVSPWMMRNPINGYGFPKTRMPRYVFIHLRTPPWPCLFAQPLPICAQASRVPTPGTGLRAAVQGLDWQNLSIPSFHLDLGKLLGAFVPVTLAVSLSYYLKIGLGKEIQTALCRSSAQLICIGFVLDFVFEGERFFLSVCSVLLMVLIAGHTAGERAKKLPRSRLVATLSITVGAVGTLVLILMLRVFPMKPRFIIPTAGYVIGNSMSMVGGALNRLYHDIRLHKGQIETALALGASAQQAVHHHVQHAVIQGMAPLVDSIKTAGLISLPGSMTGMLMGGSSPLEAVQMQLQVLYMLLGCAAVSSIISSYLGWRMMFTESQQLFLD